MILLLIGGIFAFYYLLVRPYNYWKNMGVKQCKPWILFGDMWGVFFRLMDGVQAEIYQYKQNPNARYYGIYRFFRPTLVINDPELIKSVTVKDFDHFTDHVAIVDPKADPLFARNVLVLRGDEWRKMRSTLTGSFTTSKMKIMFNLITEASENLANYFEKQPGNVVEFEMKDLFARFTIDVIATTSFGVRADSLREKNNEFYQMSKEISDISFIGFLKIMLFQISPRLYRFLRLKMFRRAVSDFFTTLVVDTIKTRKEQGVYRPDLLQILLEAKKGIQKDEEKASEVGFAVAEDYATSGKSKIQEELTYEDMTAQALIFFFAGFDSVSSLMTFTAYELAVNPDVQEKLRQEVQETFKECSGKVTYEAIANMKYMDMVISESLRKWPPFIALGRECTKPYVIEPKLPGEKTLLVPKGMGIQIPLSAIHHDEKYYPNPGKFDPERFSPENRNKLIPYTYLGFGQGPRNCLGSRFALLEVKIIFFYVLNRMKLVTTEKTQIPLKLSKKFSINIRPEHGLWVALQKL